MSIVADMAILTTKQVWRRVPRRRRRGTLSAKAQVNVRRALLFLAARCGSPDQLAEALDIMRAALWKARAPRRPRAWAAPPSWLARRASIGGRALGAWPGDACPACGGTGRAA